MAVRPYILFSKLRERYEQRDMSSDGEGYQEACCGILGYDVVDVAGCIYTHTPEVCKSCYNNLIGKSI